MIKEMEKLIMTKVAVIFADGCEEVEGLSVVDVLRRLNVDCDMIGLDKTEIIGDHKIKIECKDIVNDNLLDYDLVAFPGGVTGANNLRDSKKLEEIIVKRNKDFKWNAAMCAGPLALGKYKVLKDAQFTCYPGFEKGILEDCPSAKFSEKITVTDSEHKIITSRGPATAWAYSYAIAEALDVDTKALKEGMLYNYLADNIKDSL